MRTPSQFAILLLVLLLGVRPLLAGNLEIIDHWGGIVRDDSVKDSLPTPLAIRDKFAWDDLWKATHPDDPEGISPPAVDFDTDMVLVAIVPGPNKAAVDKLSLDGKGNVDVVATGTKMAGPGFGFVFIRVPKDGVKSVNGKPLVSSVKIKSQKSGTSTTAALIPPSGAITDKATFQKTWTAWSTGTADKPWDVDFEKELVLVIPSAKSAIKVDDVTLDTFGDVKVISDATPVTGTATFGYTLLLIDRDGVVSVNGKAISSATKAASSPAK